MNEKITNEIDDILDTNTENLSSTSNSLVKKYLFKFIIALLVISILLVPKHFEQLFQRYLILYYRSLFLNFYRNHEFPKQ